MTIRRIGVADRRLASGRTARVAVVHADSLDAVPLRAPAHVRATDVAHHLEARYERSFVAYALPPHPLRAADAALPFEESDSTRPLSLRAAIVQEMQRYLALPSSSEGDVLFGDRAANMRILRERGHLALERHGKAGVLPSDFVPVGSVGFPRSITGTRPEAAVANTHFFVFDLLELDSPYAALGDAVGMLAANGRIVNPPLLPRAALLHAAGRWFVGMPCATDLDILTDEGTLLHTPGGEGVTLYYRGKEDVEKETPRRSGAFEVCLQGRFASVVHRDGGFPIPHGALVLSWHEAPSEEIVRSLTSAGVVRYRLAGVPDLVAAVQAGPRLLEGGDICLTDASFLREGFRTVGHPFPSAPLVFPTDVDGTVAARTGVGVTGAGSIVLVAIEGSSSLATRHGLPVRGATLLDLAYLLREEGAVDALNLDGGGSTQLFHGTSRLIEPSDARRTNRRFERPVPAACVLH